MKAAQRPRRSRGSTSSRRGRGRTAEAESPVERLRALVQSRELSAPTIEARREEVRRQVLETSPCIDGPDFTRIQYADVERTFDAIDQRSFDGLLGEHPSRSRLSFRLSKRMTSSGGKTVARRAREGAPTSFEIVISSALLFDAFADPHREMSVAGLPCTDRLAALVGIVEHEMVHLAETWLWEESSCAQPRFQGIARRLFGHSDHLHRLVTPRERASLHLGVRVGRRVAFTFEGRRCEGIVNRVTRRATVLVQDPRGEPYSDGQRYLKFYVPLEALEVLDQPAARCSESR